MTHFFLNNESTDSTVSIYNTAKSCTKTTSIGSYQLRLVNPFLLPLVHSAPVERPGESNKVTKGGSGKERDRKEIQVLRLSRNRNAYMFCFLRTAYYCWNSIRSISHLFLDKINNKTASNEALQGKTTVKEKGKSRGESRRFLMWSKAILTTVISQVLPASMPTEPRNMLKCKIIAVTVFGIIQQPTQWWQCSIQKVFKKLIKLLGIKGLKPNQPTLNKSQDVP